MNTIIIRIRSVARLSVVTFLLLTGCVKRDLEMRSQLPPAPKKGYAEIALDWGDATAHPQTVRLLFYDEAGMLVQEAKGLTDGFRDSIAAGKYRIAVHNEDALNVNYRGMESYTTAEVFAQEMEYTPAPAIAWNCASRNPVIPRILEPQSVFGTGRFTEFETLEITVGKPTRATVNPKLLTHEVEFHFVVMSDIAVQTFTGVLNGVAPGIYFSTGKHNAAPSCAIEFAAVPIAKTANKEYTALLNVFNLLTTAQSPDGTNTIDVALELVDGRKFQLQVDLTSTLKQIIADNGGEIPMEIPVEVTFYIVGLDLTATVTPWDQSGTGGGDPRPQTVTK